MISPVLAVARLSTFVMGGLRIRLRTPNGQASLTAEAGISVAALRSLIEEKSAIPAARQQLLVGYPPVAMADDHMCTDGETIIVRDEAPESPPVEAAPLSAAAAPLPTMATAAPAAPVAPAARGGASSDGVAVRSVIAADNNCLFAALIHVLRLDVSPQELRETVKRCVLADPIEWNEGILGLEPTKYVEWITAKDHWGGEIELRILSRHLRKQVAVFDIVSQQLYRYGEGDVGCDEMVFLLYDGIHYDAIVCLPAEGVPEEFGTSVFAATDEHAIKLARRLQAEAHSARAFTDTARFTLRCLVCQAGLVGEKGAQEHAKATGHINFSEY